MSSMRTMAATAAMVLAAGSAVTLGAWQQGGTNTTNPRGGTTPTNQQGTNQNQPTSSAGNQGNQINNNQNQINNNLQNNRAGMTTSAYAADYRSASSIKGADIMNWNNEDVGSVDDLVIDRGSGQITHVVVKSGTLLGMGGRSVMIPYREFQWDSGRGRLMLGSTDVGDFPAFTTESWKSMRTSTRPATSWRDNRSGREMNGTDRNRTTRSTDEPRAQNTGEGATNAPTNRDPAGASPGQRNDPNDRRPGDTGTGATPAGQDEKNTRDQIQNSRPGDERATNRGEGATNSPTNRDPRGASPQQQWARGSSEEAPPLNDWMWDQTNNRYNDDMYGWSSGQSQKIEGEIKRVDRQYTGQGEQVVLEIQTSDGKTQRVAVGPSWYVTGGDTAFNRGDRVTIDAVPMYVARTASVNGKEFKYRDEQGKPAWSGDSFAYGGTNYSAPAYRNLLLSDLRGAKLDCRGTACGRIDDVILEMNSGMVAFLSIDPDQNFLGIADTKRLAPWSVASIGADGRVRVDAAKEMMLSTTKTPEDITTLNRDGSVDTIYNAYQVPARDYDRWRDDSTYRYGARREREMWRRNQNYQDSPRNPNSKSNPTPSGTQPTQPR